jgi:quaternary ammonium compound-resistance protein SugE
MGALTLPARTKRSDGPLCRCTNTLPMFTVTNTTSAWLLILLSGLLEIGFSVSLMLSQGFSRFAPSVIAVLAALLSIWLMSLTLSVLPIGTAYAVWAGIGAAGTAVIGMLFFDEPTNLARIICIGLVVVGIVGLQLQTKA